MRNRKIRRWINREMEKEVRALEKGLEGKEELSSLEMPEGSYEELLKRIEASKLAEKEPEKEASLEKCGSDSPRPRRVFPGRRRGFATAVLVGVLIAGLGLGVSGAKLFVLDVENRVEDGEFNVRITNGDDVTFIEVTEDEAYEEIEEKIGIQALRLGYKPEGMELEKVYIGEDMGEAQMEFYFGENILKIYENKQSEDATFNMQYDGKIVDTVDIFFLGKELEIKEIDKDSKGAFLSISFEQNNAYYNVSSNLQMEEFKQIISEIFFKSV